MRIPKLLPAICAAAFCAGFITVRAEDNPAQAAARAALMEKLSEWDVQQAQPAQPAATKAKPVVVPPSKPASIAFPGKELGLKPIEAPPPPVSAAQEAQLQALLERYKANQITPEQYQTERAKILAEP
jgi:hypothetical protein